MTRIILHVGTHKTGTTGLQRSLFEQREYLKGCGISYDPWPGVLASLKYAHHGLAHRLASFDSEDQKVLARYRVRLEEALGSREDVIISAEPFYRHVAAGLEDDPVAARICYLNRIADYFKGLPVEVSICFRRPDRMAESVFKEQAVSTGNQLEFLPWLDKFADRFDYTARLAEFEQHFGPAKVWCFEDAVAKGLLPAFFEAHQLKISNFENAKADRKSISTRATEWLLAAKRAVDDMSVSERHVRWYYASSSHAHPALAHVRGDAFWVDTEARDNFLRAALVSFRHADFWSQPDDVVKHVNWTVEQQSEVETHFENWSQKNVVLLEMRKAARLAPYDLDDAIPHSVKWKFLPKRIRARFFGSKSNWRG